VEKGRTPKNERSERRSRVGVADLTFHCEGYGGGSNHAAVFISIKASWETTLKQGYPCIFEGLLMNRMAALL
jgi:uncharacterized Zn-finger protein